MSLQGVRAGLQKCLLATLRSQLANGLVFAQRARTMTSDRESASRARQYRYATSAYARAIRLRGGMHLVGHQAEEVEKGIGALAELLARAGYLDSLTTESSS